METRLTVGEFKKLVRESAGEFKPKFGVGYNAKDEKKENDKSYKDSEKKALDYNPMKEPKKAEYKKVDANRTTLDIQPDNELDDATKERYKAQAEGYTSVAEKNNGIEKSGEFNDKEYKGFKKSAEDFHKNEKLLKKSGLAARTYPDDAFDREDMYEGVSYNTAYFKKTQFLTEGHMASLIPDELKEEGKRFWMKDKTGNRYLVEWSDNRSNIITHVNKQGMMESINRMKELMNYNPNAKIVESKNSRGAAVSEDFFQATMDNARKYIK